MHASDLHFDLELSDLCVELKDHQIVGIKRALYQWSQSGFNGMILADEMGLGKILQAIVAAKAAPKSPGHCFTLIVVTPSTVKQWEKEIFSRYKSVGGPLPALSHNRLARYQ